MPTISMYNDQVQPYVEILEQPASKALRFRYECEGRSAGSIPGVNSTPENKTFPSIRIVGYKGPAKVIVSCVTKDTPYRPHPHNLVGKKVCKQGVCTVEIPSGNMVVTFSNLGIQCVRRQDIEEALRVRQELRIDPFRTGFEHKRHPNNIDLNAVRLCFQVFLQGSQRGIFNKPLPPIVSNSIYDKKAMVDLAICKLSHCSASVAGGMDMILLCEKVKKDDIEVRFFEVRDGQLFWEGKGDFSPTNVHKQTAIAFRTPSYCTQQVEQPVRVNIQLRRPSDGATSEPLSFQMLPLGTDRPAFWSSQKAFAGKKADYSTFSTYSTFLSTEAALLTIETCDRPKKPKLDPTVSAETENHVELPEWTIQRPFEGPSASTSNFTPPPQSSTQRLQVSPRQTPYLMEYSSYNPPLIQQPYRSNSQPTMQHPNISVPIDIKCCQSQFQQSEPNLPILTRVTPKNQDELHLNSIGTTGAPCLLDMDNQQLNFDCNSNDLTEFVANLSSELSTILSISDSIYPEANNVEERNMNELSLIN